MKVYKDIAEFTKLSNAVVTTGTYDGVHVGHRKILQTLVKVAKENKGETVVITFWPHPRKIIGDKNQQEIKYLSTLDEKIELLASIGIDHLIIIPFNRDFSELSSTEFIQSILIDKIGTKKLVIGYDHRFGKNREGSFEYLKNESWRLGFEVIEIPRQDLNDIAISSTQIRQALAKGDVAAASQYLEQPYKIKGIVVKGNQVGRTIGFPTANIKIQDPDKLTPSDGVYAVKVFYKNTTFNGMLNIGFRPTVDGKNKTIEVHIFDFNNTIYGEELEIHFIEFIRAEKKFSGKEELQNQLKADADKAKTFLTKL